MHNGYEKCISTGKDRDAPQFNEKWKFDPLAVDITNPDTAIQLLKSHEKPILLAASAALSKFGMKNECNLKALFDLDIVDTVLPLIQHNDLFTRRFALKILAQMSAISNVQNHLLHNDCCMYVLIRTLIHETDTFLHEFSSAALAEMTKDIYGVVRLRKISEDLGFDCSYLIEKLKCQDPDVQNNTLEIILNVLKDPSGAKMILQSENLDLTTIYRLFSQSYPTIQRLALEVIKTIVSRNKDLDLQEAFRGSGGLSSLLDILECGDWQDLHSETLNILSLASDCVQTVESLIESGGLSAVMKYLENPDNVERMGDTLNILVKLTNTERGRKVLHCQGFVNSILSIFRENIDPEYNGACCYGMAKMTRYRPAAEELAIANPMKEILDVLRNERFSWDTRETAAFALKELLSSDYRNSKNFLEIKGQVYLASLLKDTIDTVPIEIQILAVQAITSITEFSTLLPNLIDENLFSALCVSFEANERIWDELKIASCGALSAICVEQKAIQLFANEVREKKLLNLMLDTQIIPVRNAAIQLTIILCSDPTTADLLIKEGYLDYMLKNREMASILTSWNTCIDALLEANLSLKFAYTGRLSLHDITKDGFYILRRCICPFPFLEDIFRLQLCPREPIYVVNFEEPETPELENNFKKRYSQLQDFKERMRSDSISKGIPATEATINFWAELKFGQMQTDSDLRKYLQTFKLRLSLWESNSSDVICSSNPLIIDVRTIRSRALFLGKYVARQMSGSDPTNRCVDHQVDLHIQEIKKETETSVIPLGKIRVGMYLERALLFKVIADKICLPASLVRGEYAKAWIEIAVPEYEVVDAGEKDSLLKTSTGTPGCWNMQQTMFPTKLLRPNYIVDLMENPGALIPMNSRHAQRYTGIQMKCNLNCCKI